MTTITKNTKVIYKRPKNKRRFHIDDVEILNHIMQEAVNLQHTTETQPDIETMELDSYFVHDLCTCFLALYTKLIEENLILTGNPHKISLTLH